MITFGNTWFWFGVLVLTAIAGYGIWLYWNKKQGWFSHFLSTMRNWKEDEQKKKQKYVCLFFALFFLLIAGTRPQWGVKENVIQYEGLDIIFALDVSKSMRALDFSTSTRQIDRLTISKELIKNFVQKREQDRFGLVTFAGESFVSVPVTFDRKIFLNFLEEASEEDVRIPGTNISEALGVSLERLTVRQEEERGKAIILITDGDETADSKIKSLARVAETKKVPIFTIGIGSSQGVRIPEGKDVFGRIIYKQYEGHDVVTKLNQKVLQDIADISGGDYFHAENFEDLTDLSQSLNRLPKTVLEQLNINKQEDRYQIFVGLGLLFFLAYLFFPTGKVYISKS